MKHPAIVRIHDFFFAEGDPWIVMDYSAAVPWPRSSTKTHWTNGPSPPSGCRYCGAVRSPQRLGGAPGRKPSQHRGGRGRLDLLVDFGIAKIQGDTTVTGQRRCWAHGIRGTGTALGGPFGAPRRFLSLGVTFFCRSRRSPFLAKAIALPSWLGHDGHTGRTTTPPW